MKADKVPKPGQIRLVNGRGRCSGRIEILYGGSWGTVCDDDFDMQEAKVVCKQLNCGVALDAKIEGYFGEGRGNILLVDLKCKGDEAVLWQCPHSGWNLDWCSHLEDAGVVCLDSMKYK